MADAAYDAVIVGGGHHSTILACYLAKAGLKTAVLERHPALGGAAVTEEDYAPGFKQSPCAHFTRFYGHPAYEDFDLPGEGLEYVFPEQNEGMIFEDGSSFIGYSAYRVVDQVTGRTELAEDNVKKTYEQIRGFSSGTPTRTCACSTSIRSIGRRRFTGTGSRRRRRGRRRIRWRSCCRFRTVGSNRYIR